MKRYRTYGDALKKKYGEKVYRIPIHLPLTCPNRDGTLGVGGCIFCGEGGVSFEGMPSSMEITEQLKRNIEYIGSRYSANRFIAYFQNYTNTYMKIEEFQRCVLQVLREDVVAIAISTRPDCIQKEQLNFLAKISQIYQVDIIMEMGLQSVNDETLKILQRGHSVESFLDAMAMIRPYGFETVVHMILDLPWDEDKDILAGAKLLSQEKVDGVKLHSLYILRGTVLGQWYAEGRVHMGTAQDYIRRCVLFLTHLHQDIVIQRIAGRAPEQETLFCNYGMSWWKLKEAIEAKMEQEDLYQGMFYDSSSKG